MMITLLIHLHLDVDHSADSVAAYNNRRPNRSTNTETDTPVVYLAKHLNKTYMQKDSSEMKGCIRKEKPKNERIHSSSALIECQRKRKHASREKIRSLTHSLSTNIEGKKRKHKSVYRRKQIHCPPLQSV